MVFGSSSGAERAEHALRAVALHADVKLHHHALAAVLASQLEQQRSLELLLLVFCRQFAVQPLSEDRLDLVLCRRGKGHALHAVVGDPAAQGDEEGQALFQHLDQLREAPDLAQTGEIVKVIGLLDPQSSVGPEAGQHLHAEALVPGDLFVPLEGIRRVVGGAEGFHVRVHDQLPGGKRFQLLVAELPDLLCRIAVERAFIAETALQLQVAPVVKRVADGKAERLRPLLEFLAVGGFAGDETLVHARPAHEPPLVVIAAEPDLRDVFKLPVLADLLRVQLSINALMLQIAPCRSRAPGRGSG